VGTFSGSSRCARRSLLPFFPTVRASPREDGDGAGTNSAVVIIIIAGEEEEYRVIMASFRFLFQTTKSNRATRSRPTRASFCPPATPKRGSSLAASG